MWRVPIQLFSIGYWGCDYRRQPGQARRHGIYPAGPLERFALLYGQGRVEPYEPYGACLVEFGDGIS